MFEWCQNLQPHDNHELVFSTNNNPYKPSPSGTNQYPKFAMTATKKARALQSETKHGIKTHFNKSLKTNRSTQVTLITQPARNLVDGATQTSRIIIQNPKVPSVIRSTSREAYLVKQQNVSSGPVEKLTYSQNSLWGSKGKYIEYKIQVTKQTKASNCLIETKDRGQYNNSLSNLLKNIESCHITQQNQRLKTSEGDYSDRRNIDVVQTDKQNEEEIAVKQSSEPANYVNTSINEGERLTLKSIYCQSIQNVESQFKFTDKKQSQHKYKLTPNRKILFRDRETIVSRENQDSHRQEQSYRVDQSILCEPTIRELFTPIGQLQHYNNFTLSLAKQNITGMILSITQVKTCYMDKISEELFIYQELSCCNNRIEGILPLFQTQMDHGCYLLIKQPFTETLKDFLDHQHTNAVAGIVDQLQTTLQKLSSIGFYLRSPVKIDDVVLVFQQVKIHHLGLFSKNPTDGIQISSTMNCIKQEMLQMCSHT